jgi:hypothetical protein
MEKELRMKRGWAMAAAAALAVLGAQAAAAAETAKAPALSAVELSEKAVCEEAPGVVEELAAEAKCEDYGFFAADKKAECEKSCKKGKKCQKKEQCGGQGCPEPGYCWKCG